MKRKGITDAPACLSVREEETTTPSHHLTSEQYVSRAPHKIGTFSPAGFMGFFFLLVCWVFLMVFPLMIAFGTRLLGTRAKKDNGELGERELILHYPLQENLQLGT